MSKPLFLQIHTLTSYPAVLLNRDDVGFAKRLPFGGATRTRISSQCLKRHWRSFDGEQSLASIAEGTGFELSVRSRQTFERFVVAPLLARGVDAALARAATEAIMIAVLGESAKAKKSKEDAKTEDPEAKAKRAKGAKKDAEASLFSLGDDEAKKAKGAKKEAGDGEAKLHTGQITVLGRPELEFFTAEAAALAADAGSADKVGEAAKRRFTKDWGKNLDGLRRAAGLDAALFGRMVTSDKLARADAAIHVAHAFTVHAEHTETDYFSAVDDLLKDGEDGELGSGHIGTTELTSGLFYGYVVVDVAQLVSNLEGGSAKKWREQDRKLAAQVAESMVHLMARVSPGAKKGSTAPYAAPHLTLVEAGASQPRTLANAFLAPVKAQPDLVANTYDALAGYVTDTDQVFAPGLRRAYAAIGGKERLARLGASVPLADVARFAASAVLEGA